MGCRFGSCGLMTVRRRIGRLNGRRFGLVGHRLLRLFFRHRCVMAIGGAVTLSIVAIGLRRIRRWSMFSTRIPMDRTLDRMLPFRKRRTVLGWRGVTVAFPVPGSSRIACPSAGASPCPSAGASPWPASAAPMAFGRRIVAAKADHAHQRGHPALAFAAVVGNRRLRPMLTRRRFTMAIGRRFSMGISLTMAFGRRLAMSAGITMATTVTVDLRSSCRAHPPCHGRHCRHDLRLPAQPLPA